MEDEREYTLTVRHIDQDTRKQLKLLSFETDKSINAIVLELIENGLKQLAKSKSKKVTKKK